LFPHVPQLFGSNFVSVQTPEHSERPPVHPPPLQLLFVHVPLEQTMPQPPQLFGSVEASTHAPPPQLIFGAAHEHFPSRHFVPPVHVIPQPPQFEPSVCTSTHALAQFAVGAVQLVPQPPMSQTWVGGHTLVQLPQ
jgi:hypothetical protein